MAGDREQRRQNREPRARDRFSDTVRRKIERRLRARRGEERPIWFWLGMFGMVGWAVAIPAVAGIAAGVWLDRHVDGDISWTLTLLFVGVAVGCLHAWYWVRQESRRD